MEYRRLGRSGAKVSVIGLGNWLTHGGYVAEQNAIASIRRAFDLGINFFDTANAYNRGAAEEVLGRGLRAYDRRLFSRYQGVLAHGRRTKRSWTIAEAPDRAVPRFTQAARCGVSRFVSVSSIRPEHAA